MSGRSRRHLDGMAPIVLGPREATCEVLTFKEGVLSPMAHDLLLRASSFEIVVTPAPLGVTATVDARSLRVVAAMHGGRPAPDALAPRDKAEIEATTRAAVLDAERHAEIRFASTEASPRNDGWHLRGTLTVAGVERPIALDVRRAADRLVAEVRLHQPDFGIRPYRAMLGALRVQADVTVRVSAPASIVAA